MKKMNRRKRAVNGTCLCLCLLFLLVSPAGCRSTHNIHVGNVPATEPVPDHLLVVYVEQMRYLAMHSDPGERDDRLRKLNDIDGKIKEVKILLEEYRSQYGYRTAE